MSRTGHDAFSISAAGPGTYPFTLLGGEYAIVVHATFGGGNVVLNIIAGDGTSQIPVVAALTADTFATFDLPNGSYNFVVTTATGVYANIVGIAL